MLLKSVYFYSTRSECLAMKQAFVYFRCKHRKIFKVYLSIFQRYTWMVQDSFPFSLFSTHEHISPEKHFFFIKTQSKSHLAEKSQPRFFLVGKFQMENNFRCNIVKVWKAFFIQITWSMSISKGKLVFLTTLITAGYNWCFDYNYFVLDCFVYKSRWYLLLLVYSTNKSMWGQTMSNN